MTAPIIRIGISALKARLGGVDASTIYRWYKSGRFPEPEYVTDKRTWRVDVIEAWEREQLARPPSARRGAANLRGAPSEPAP